MRKKRLFSMVLSVVLLTGVCAQTVCAEDLLAPVEDITFDGITYHDIDGGAQEGRTDTSDAVRTYMKLIQSNEVLSHWAQLAYSIYGAYPKSYYYLEHDTSDDKSLDDWGNGTYADLVNDLTQKTSSGYNTQDYHYGGNYQSSTGLSYAGSLNEVYLRAGEALQTGLNRKMKAKDFLDKAALKGMEDDQAKKSQTVLYSLDTQIKRKGASQEWGYNCFGLAFYNLKLIPLTGGDDVVFNTALGDESLDDVIDQKKVIKGVSYTPGNTGEPVTNYTRNLKDDELIAHLTLENSQSDSTATTVTTGESDGYTESVGFEVAWGKKTNAGKKNESHLDFSVSLGMTTEQVFSKSFSEEKSSTVTKKVATETELKIPGHCSAGVTTVDTDAQLSIDYDCPMAVSYDVAIFSIVGNCYDDNAAVQDMVSSSHYAQRAFMTTFGKGTDNAIQDLKARAITNKDINNYEPSHGMTKGTRHKERNWVNEWDNPWVEYLDWDAILKKSPASKSGNVEDSAGKTIAWLTSNSSMSATGANMLMKTAAHDTKTIPIQPIYPLSKIELTDPEHTEYILRQGESLFMDNIGIKGYDGGSPDGVNLAYYGFSPQKGEWAVVDDAGDKQVGYKTVEIKDNVNGNAILTAKEPGTVKLAYFIDEDAYTSLTEEGKYAQNETVKRPMIVVTVQEKEKEKFSGTVKVKGKLKLTASKEAMNLDDPEVNTLDVTVLDSKGKEIDVPVIWEAQEIAKKGIEIIDNQMTVKKAGTFHIRAVYDGVESDWVKIKVEEETKEEPKEKVTETESDDPEDAIFEETRKDAALKDVTDAIYDLVNEEGDGSQPAEDAQAEDAQPEQPAEAQPAEDAQAEDAQPEHPADAKPAEEAQPEQPADAKPAGDVQPEAEQGAPSDSVDTIQWAWDNDMLQCFQDEPIVDDGTISREQLITIVYDTAKFLEQDVTVDQDYLTDIPKESEPSEWAKEAVNWAISQKVLSQEALEKGEIDPQARVSDEDSATFLHLCFDQFEP